MSRAGFSAWRLQRRMFCALAALLLLGGPVFAATLVLRDGRLIEGDVGVLSSMDEGASKQPPSSAVDVRLILMLDDHLRRTFVPKKGVNVNERELGESQETFRLPQPKAEDGGRVVMVGPIVQIDRFDDFGRRILKMNTVAGELAVIQGITQITPKWTKIEALKMKNRNYVWDMRVATSSIPPEDLDRLLNKQVDPKSAQDRLRVVRFYLEMEQYKEAEERLKKLLEEFPDKRAEFQPLVSRLHQAYARRILSEVEVRRNAGQHMLASAMLNKFPIENVAGEVLETVREATDNYRLEFQRGKTLIGYLDADIAKLDDPAMQARLKPIRDEIFAEVNLNTINRFAPYEQLHDDDTLTAENKLALAVSGWVVGNADVVQLMSTALSLYDMRGLVEKYLGDTNKLQREALLEKLRGQEGGTPGLVAKIAWNMKPPLPPGEPIANQPGMYLYDIDVLPGLPATSYVVQVPPEYDPHRLYPTIVALHGAGATPAAQIDWWCGTRGPDGGRQGQAARYGYIVVAPAWTPDHKRNYEYSGAEHAAVLNSLRDAMRHFAIDTDRVYLSGHSMGGDAAWDIGMAHPDHWAGVIPISAKGDRYVSHTWENAAYVPFYLVNGELDGTKALDNAVHLNRYMTHGYDLTVVEYQGRGHEHFSDEILRLFDWMGRRVRNFALKKFTCRTSRAWDNYFWWVEIEDLPARTLIEPTSWPPPGGYISMKTQAEINPTGGINVTTGAGKTTLWLSPDTLDFAKKPRITVNGKMLHPNGAYLSPDLAVIMEDLRRRGDRQHPFWCKVEMPTGRINDVGIGKQQQAQR